MPGIDYQANVICRGDLASLESQTGWGILWINAETGDFLAIRDSLCDGVTRSQELVDLGICAEPEGELTASEQRAYAIYKIRMWLSAHRRRGEKIAWEQANQYSDGGDTIGGEP